MSWRPRRRSWLMLGLLALALLQGCASVQRAVKGDDPRDPLEPLNRHVHAFNDQVDAVVARPLALTYVELVPSLVRTGVGNVLSNLRDVWTLANAVLQIKPQMAAETFMRINVNTFIGLGGVFDVASEMHIPHHKEDFGQTLGRWGVPAGPYLVLPLLGPSSVRDGLALPLDMRGDAVQHFVDAQTRTSLGVLRLVDTRAGLLQTVDAVRAAALDPYTFVRDAYLQKRRNDVYDGNPPSTFDFSDPDMPGSR